MYRLATALFVSLFGFAASAEGVRLNQIQIIGTHNSYHLSMGEERLKQYAVLVPEAKAWDYEHAPLDVQLEHGVRSFELDLYWDGARLHVMHVPHFDDNSSCEFFEDCLLLIRGWSAENRSHVPIVVLIELKQRGHEFDADLRDFTPEAVEVMESLTRQVFPPERLLTPDDVRGEAATLEGAVTGKGWPLLDDVRGRVMFVLHETGTLRDWYLEGRPSAEGRAMFPQSVPGELFSAFIINNNPYSDKMRPWLEQGYMIRTRADSGANAHEKDLAPKRDQALACGAQVIHTDYPPGEPCAASGYVVSFDDSVPARCNPVTYQGKCPNLEP